MHRRQEIRERVRTLLGGLSFTTVGDHRLEQLASADLPAANINTAAERANRELIDMAGVGAPCPEAFELDLVIELTADATSGQAVADALDTLQESIQDTLRGDATLAGLVIAYWLENVDTVAQADLGPFTMVRTLTYTMQYDRS